MRLMLGIAAAASLGCSSRAADKPGTTNDSSQAAGSPSTNAATRAPTAAAAGDLSFGGLGAIHIGMSRRAAESALGGSLAIRGNDAWTNCGYIVNERIPAHVRVMVEAGSIARIEIDSGAAVASDGIRIGDPESRVLATFGGRVTRAPAKYTNGHVLTVRSALPADSALRLVFETDSGHVIRFRAGRVPQVDYVERCG